MWSYDFVFGQTEDGRTLKLMPVVDEYTHECLALVVSRSIASSEVTEVLSRLIRERGEPGHVHSDNGPKFVAKAVRTHFKEQGAQTRYIDPGAPWQSPYVESFNDKLRDELLRREIFGNLFEAKVLAGQYRTCYNCERPHSALGYQTPAAFATAFDTNRTTRINPEPAPALA